MSILETNQDNVGDERTEVKRALLLNVVVGQRATILKLLAGEDQALLIRGDALLVLNLRLDVVDRIRRLHLKSDSLTRQRLDEDLHTTTETENCMIAESSRDMVG